MISVEKFLYQEIKKLIENRKLLKVTPRTVSGLNIIHIKHIMIQYGKVIQEEQIEICVEAARVNEYIDDSRTEPDLVGGHYINKPDVKAVLIDIVTDRPNIGIFVKVSPDSIKKCQRVIK